MIKNLRLNRFILLLVLLAGKAGMNAQNTPPPGAINGLFSVNSTDQVYFSLGNLQFNAYTGTWRFAPNQWATIGTGNDNVSSTYNGWIDVFGWGTSNLYHGAQCYQPWNTSTTASHYYAYGSATYNLNESTRRADWGYNAISNADNHQDIWRTLTYDEWNYLLFTRSTTSGKRFAKAKVNNVNGVILLPDNWNTSTYTLNNTNERNASFNSNEITTSQWSTLENAGAVFLPVTGYRYGSSYYNNNGDPGGSYWTASYNTSYTDNAHHLNIQNNSFTIGSDPRSYGYAVRVVRSNMITFSVYPSPRAGGSVNATGNYDPIYDKCTNPYGSSCTLTATANEGYTFTNWTKGNTVVSTNPSYTFIVTESATYRANFTISSYSISSTVLPSGSGTVTGAGTYNHGSTCTLTATANNGYSFSHWKKGNTYYSNEASISFAVTESATYQACFTEIYYPISASADPTEGGTISGTGSKPYNSSCTLHANPSTGYNFLYWTKDNVQVSSNQNYTFTVTGAASYVAHFAKKTYTINVSANPSSGGTVIGAGTYEHGATCTLIATPSTGYTFVNWTKNGNQVSINASYSFTVGGAGTYEANFKCIINASANPTTGGSVSGSGYYETNANCTLIATANSGYRFINWTNNGVSVSTDPSYSFTVTSPGNYIANFIQTHDITASASPTAGGVVNGAGIYDHGSSCTLSATPATGYTFTRWEKNGVQVSTDASYTFNVTEPASYVAVFTINTYTITVTADPVAGGTVTGAGTYEHGSQCTLTAAPATGYRFVRWTKNGTQVSTSASYSITVTEAASYVAEFTLKTYTITVTKTPNNNYSGSVSGGGTYSHGSTCTLTASPNTYYDYVFVNWTKNEEEVSINPSYSFTVTENSSYVAHFTQTSPLTYSYNNNNYTATVTGFKTGASGTGTLIIPSRVQYNNHNYTVTTIGEQAFWDKTGITGTVTLPSSVTSIEYGAFRGCTGITGLDLANVVTVGDGAFCYCSGLTGTLTIPNSVTSIGIQAFYECTGITTIAVGSAANMQTGFNNPFVGCSAVTNVTVDPNNPYFDSRNDCKAIIKTSNNELVFGCSTAGFIPNTVTSIGDCAFLNQTNLSAVYFPTSLVSIGTSAFSGCTNLFKNIIVDLTIPNGVITIGDEAFYNCPNLIGTLTIPNSVTTIGNNAFGCESSTTKITTLNIGSGVTNIGYNAFLNRRCTSINVDAQTPPAIGNGGAFVNIYTAIPVTIPCGTLADFQNAYGWSMFTNLQDGSFEIAASVNQSTYGSVSGAGSYCVYEACTLTATANVGYTFVNWTEGGNVVSTNASYTFTATGARSLVANFQLDGRHFTTAGDWSNSANWAGNALPGTTDDVTIHANCNLNQNTTVASLTINEGILTVKSGYILNVTGTLTNTTAANLVVEDGALLIMESAGVKATVKKEIIAATNWTTESNGWYFIASPIDGEVNPSGAGLITDSNLGDAGTISDRTYDLYYLDGGNEKWKNYRNTQFNMNNGQGYLYANASNVTLAFSGDIKPYSTSSNTVTLAKNGWNLIGNPFTCAVSVNKAFVELNHGTAVTSRAVGHTINPCMGIAVYGSENETVTFVKVEPNNAAAPGNGSLNITVAEQVATRGGSSTSTVTLDNAVISFDQGCELPKFELLEGNAKLYIPQDNVEYAIVSVDRDAMQGAITEIPVNFKAAKNGTYTLTVSSPLTSQFSVLRLIDNLTGVDVDLLQTPEYTFSAKTNDYPSRFKLVFNENDNENENFAFVSNGEIVVQGTGTLQVIDVLGRQLLSRQVSSDFRLPNSDFSMGVYVLRLVDGDNVKTQKIVIR